MYKVKVKKVKFTLKQAMKTQRGVEMQLYFFFNLGVRWWLVVDSTPRSLCSRERDTKPIVQEAVWAPGPFWTGEENLVSTGIRSRTILNCINSCKMHKNLLQIFKLLTIVQTGIFTCHWQPVHKLFTVVSMQLLLLSNQGCHGINTRPGLSMWTFVNQVADCSSLPIEEIQM